MVRVIVFKETGEVRLATLLNPRMGVKKENLKEVKNLPENLINKIPKSLFDFCKQNAPQYLYAVQNGTITDWKTKPVLD